METSTFWRLGLFAGLFFSRFSKPDTGAAAVLVDELDAGGFQGLAQRRFVGFPLGFR